MLCRTIFGTEGAAGLPRGCSRSVRADRSVSDRSNGLVARRRAAAVRYDLRRRRYHAGDRSSPGSERDAAWQSGGAARIATQHAKGRLIVRKRIELLLDDCSFEEWNMFVEHRCTDFGMAERRGHRRRRHRRPAGVRVQPGLHGVRRLAVKICKVMDHAVKMGAPVTCGERS